MRPKEQFLQTILFLFWSYAKARTNWKLGLEIENAIKVDNSLITRLYSRHFRHRGRDTYPKLKLILCGFHEATLMCQAAYQIINPGKKYVKIHYSCRS
jgi:hypothetical protein